MKRQGGFTLIELVVVIVILGILAVTAAPKFLNMQGDARTATLNGLKGAMKGATGIIYGKAAIQGIETTALTSSNIANQTVDNVVTHYGYPDASATGIGAAIEFDSNDWALVADTNIAGKSDSDEVVFYTVAGQAPSGTDTIDNCYVQYQRATSSAVPVITVTDCN
jgi:MSHA pilin protein MshA